MSSSSSDYIHNIPTSTSVTAVSKGSSNQILSSDVLDKGEPSPIEAEEYLINFQTHKSIYFPFIHISPTTSAQELQLDRPFLWLCIMAVGSKSTSQQQFLGSRIRQTIALEMVVQSARNIDLLLGLLVFIGWHGIRQLRNRKFSH